LFACSACTGPGPEDKLKIAKEAGSVAALSWLALEKPTAEQVVAVKFVVDSIRTGLTDWKEGGFTGSLPDIYKGIDKALDPATKPAENKLARKLAELLCGELDHQFKKRPDWQKLGAEVATIVDAFCAGASEEMVEYKPKTGG
jgi:hypothetical protein